jgi:mRNA-degrading endonuclease RelE of RelBE toxin-antitoxin system
MKWGFVIGNRAKRRHRRLSVEERERIDGVLAEICRDPLAGDVKILRGTRGVLRRRIGAWRIIFELDRDKNLILIIAVERRGSHTY